MTALPVTSRISEIEEALARALDRGDFEVISHDGERYLIPILAGHVISDAIISRPMLPLRAVARDMERAFS